MILTGFQFPLQDRGIYLDVGSCIYMLCPKEESRYWVFDQGADKELEKKRYAGKEYVPEINSILPIGSHAILHNCFHDYLMR